MGPESEASVDGEPVLDLRARPEAVDDRSALAAALAAARFPARRDELIADAEESCASEGVMRRLRELPADREFPNVQSVWATLGDEVDAGHQ